ncbi:Fpg/Nei family DNA glycosylase [Stomatohabitans albus]|uniref:Fpg/Nei family DNA glycosylase n=1 Tax=Stomatohabitans albus TaxID=3110766 RepID=UPI00300D15B1
MTQLPEAELIFREMEKELAGKRIKDVWVAGAKFVREPSTMKAFVAGIQGAKIGEVTRRGTAILIELDGDRVLVILPGDRARMVRHTANAKATETVRLTMSFSTGGSVHYSDLNSDGQFLLIDTERLDAIPEFQNLGLDPLDEPIPWPVFSADLEARKRPLLEVLVDTSFIVGIGEIYANEVLFRAGLHPLRMSDTLSNQEVRRLHRSVLELVNDAIKAGGIDVLVEGDPDAFLPFDELELIEVYGRAGQPDTRSRATIERFELEGGLTAFASSAQS